MSEQPTERSARKDAKPIQRGRTSPSHTLEESLAGVASVFKSLGTTPHSRDDAATAMGYKPGSGAANARVGSLTHFGLLDRHGANYRVSDLARRILECTSDDERRQAIAEAAASPSLYTQLLADLDGQPFPPMLSNILSRNYGVVPKSASEVANRFQETLSFAGLLKDGKVYASLNPPRHGASMNGPNAGKSASPGRGSDYTGGTGPRPPSTASPSAYQVPLRKGRTAVLDLPRPIDATDIERIKQWLDLMGPVLTERPDEKDDVNEQESPEAID